MSINEEPKSNDNENNVNPINFVINLERKVNDSSDKLKNLYERYNSIIENFGTSTNLEKYTHRNEYNILLNKISSDIENIGLEIENSYKEIDALLTKIEKGN